MGLFYTILGSLSLLLAVQAAPAEEAHHTPSTQFCVPQVVSAWEQERIFTTFIHELYTAKRVPLAFHTYVQNDYIQHNPFVASGAQAALDFLTSFVPQLNITVYHNAFDQGVGWIHYRAIGAPLPVETAIVDVYRFNGSCVAEHWDVIQSLPSNATNPLALF